MTVFNNKIAQYKHDTVGKFKDINAVVSNLNEASFSDPKNLELFHMVHEAITKMVITSKEVIRQSYERPMILKVVDVQLGDSLKKIQIDGLNLRLDFNENGIIYYYSVNENKEDLRIACGKLLALLPLKEVSISLEDSQKRVEIASLCEQSLGYEFE